MIYYKKTNNFKKKDDDSKYHLFFLAPLRAGPPIPPNPAAPPNCFIISPKPSFYPISFIIFMIFLNIIQIL